MGDSVGDGDESITSFLLSSNRGPSDGWFADHEFDRPVYDIFTIRHATEMESKKSLSFSA